MREVLLQKAADFQALNTAKYGINLPAGGYTINNLFAAFVADMDVAQADANYASVNVPFAMGYTYEHTFSETTARSIGWTFDPAIFGSAPFFNGVGFVGVKYLRSPVDSLGNEVGLSLFGTFSRSSGSLQDPNDDRQLYRYITGGLLPTDGACSLADPLVSKICFVNIGSAADMRFFESSGPLNLAPGGAGTIVVAYIFAAPVSAGGCPGAACDVKPATSNGDLTILGDPARMATGVNQIDHDDRLHRLQQRWPDRHRPHQGQPGRVRDAAGLPAGQGHRGAGGVRREVPAPVRAGAPRVLPGAGQQPGHRPLGRLGHGDDA